MGQRDTGSYPVHLYGMGNAQNTSWVRGCTIQTSYNRAVGVTFTQQVTLKGNVAYDIMGHAFMLSVRAIGTNSQCVPLGACVCRGVA
jgi:hypothetical protein